MKQPHQFESFTGCQSGFQGWFLENTLHQVNYINRTEKGKELAKLRSILCGNTFLLSSKVASNPPCYVKEQRTIALVVKTVHDHCSSRNYAHLGNIATHLSGLFSFPYTFC